MPSEDIPKQPDDQINNPGLVDQMLPHEGEPAGTEGAEAPTDDQTHEQIGDLATDTVVEDPDTEFRDEDAGRVDKDKAWDMAHAGYKDRSAAAEERAFANDEKTEVRGKEMEYYEHRSKPLPRRSKALGEHDRKMRDLREERDRAREIYREENHRRGEAAEENLQTSFERDPESRAKMYDRQAEQIEAWAGILHDHPVSEAFTQAHPEVEITPESLMRMEIELDRDRSGLEHADSHWYIPDVKLAGRDPHKDNNSIAKELLALADEATGEEHDKLRSDLEISIKALQDFYVSVNEKVRIQPLRNKIAVVEGFLEDIRSGRSSE